MSMSEKTNLIKTKWQDGKRRAGKYPWLTRTILGVVVLGILWSGYSWYLQKRAAIEQSLVRPVPVMATAVEQRNMPIIVNSFGDLRAIAAANLSAETAGNITHISFQGGEKVATNVNLLVIDNETQKANLEKARATQQLKKIEYTRNENLVKRGAQPQQTLDIAKAELESSNADVLAAEDAVDKTYIMAPFNGRLGARLVSVGQYVSPGQTLVEIVDADTLKIQFAVPEKYLSQLAVDQEADITTAAYPNRTFDGTVDYVAPSIDSVTRTINVEAVIDNKDGLLSPGLSVQVAQILGEDKAALIVPEEALVYAIEGPSVFIAEDDPEFELDERVRNGILEQQAAQRKVPVDELPPLQIKKVKKVKVETGTFMDGIVQITAGVKADQLVITQGQQKISDGAIVMLVDPAKRMEAEAQAAEANQ